MASPVIIDTGGSGGSGIAPWDSLDGSIAFGAKAPNLAATATRTVTGLGGTPTNLTAADRVVWAIHAVGDPGNFWQVNLPDPTDVSDRVLPGQRLLLVVQGSNPLFAGVQVSAPNGTFMLDPGPCNIAGQALIIDIECVSTPPAHWLVRVVPMPNERWGPVDAVRNLGGQPNGRFTASGTLPSDTRLALFDTSAGNIQCDLAANASLNSTITFANVAGSGDLQLNDLGGGTFNGVAGLYVLGPGESATFCKVDLGPPLWVRL